MTNTGRRHPPDSSEDEPPPRLRARSLGDAIEVWREDGDEPLLVQHAASGRRPYIGPILAPDDAGDVVARLWVALDDVNGIVFGGRVSDDDTAAGTFHPLLLGPQRLDDGGILWSVITDWRSPAGDSLLGESQRWTIADHGHAFILDLEWALSAHVDLTFGRRAGGGPVVRLAGGERTVLASDGRTAAAADGRRAKWVAVGPVAVMDHPDNPGHPVAWAVDAGTGGVVPDRFAASPTHLPAGDLLAFRYRLLLCAGAVGAATVEAAWQDFARADDDGEGDAGGVPGGV